MKFSYPPVQSASTTIEHLHQCFATHGLPEVIVSDNGPCFASTEFATYLSRNGIKQTLVAPYHPASNGQAEQAVQVVKEGLSKQSGGTLRSRLARFLLTYRTTPHTTTGVTPAELLLGRCLRTRLSCVRPDIAARVQDKQAQQQSHHDMSKSAVSFGPGQKVWLRQFSPSAPAAWVPASVVSCTRSCIL